MPAFCRRCGIRLLPDAQFCQKCGAAISVPELMPDAQGSATEPTPVPSSSALPPDFASRSSTNRSTWLKIGFLAILAVVLLLVVIATNGLSKDAPTPESSGTQWTGKRIKWTAMSHTASAITGDVETSPGSISMATNTYPLVLVRELHGDELQNSAKMLSIDAVTSSSIEGQLFKTSIPATAHLLNGNSVCSGNAAWAVVLLSHEHGSDSTAGDWLYLAFFLGGSEPVLQVKEIENSKALCSTFNYQNASKSQPTASSDASIDDIEKAAKEVDIPTSLRGRWKILRSLKAGSGNVTCMADEGETSIVGRSIEYAMDSITWNGLKTQKATAKILDVTDKQYIYRYRVDLSSLGIKSEKATVIEIAHPDANVIDCTTQIPGDTVMFKDQDTIIIWVENNYFEAVRQPNT